MKIIARPWQPQDLIDDLQSIIDEECDNYLNTRRTTLCMARDYLKEHFAEPKWISVKDMLPEYGQPVLVCDVREDYVGMAVLQPAKHFVFAKSEAYWDWDRMECNLDEFTHWQYLPQPPKGE